MLADKAALNKNCSSRPNEISQRICLSDTSAEESMWNYEAVCEVEGHHKCGLSRRLSRGSSCKVLYAWMQGSASAKAKAEKWGKAEHKAHVKQLTKAQVMAVQLPRTAKFRRWIRP